MDPGFPEPLLAELRRRHAEPQRHYHNWSHIAALLRHRDAVADRLRDSSAVTAAILFHDSIYDPQAKGNERQSAALLMAMAPPIPADSLALAHALILATETHTLPAGLTGDARSDCALFLDMDLAILGAGARYFDRYETQIRREYAHVADADFRAGRAAVLRRFAARERLYFSSWGYERFEQPARANITRSLDRLTR